jgi:metallo-beta-lactamase family protein
MCEAGRIRHHLKNNVGDPKCTVLFVGYCAEHTLGRRLRDGYMEVAIFGKKTKVRAKIEIVDSLSGHADHSELLDYFKAISGPKKKVWLVHGEKQGAMTLREDLSEIHDGEVSMGVLGEEVEF